MGQGIAGLKVVNVSDIKNPVVLSTYVTKGIPSSSFFWGPFNNPHYILLVIVHVIAFIYIYTHMHTVCVCV